MSAERRDFADRTELAKALADAVAADINRAIAESGTATIAVSGGTTPAKFFMALGKHRDIDWDKVSVTLVDERWVDETSERSNAGLVNEKMLQGPAAIAHFLPLYSGGAHPDSKAIARTNAALGGLPDQFAAVVLGMGNDGHTASFFPDSDELEAALSEQGPAIATLQPTTEEQRVSLTLPRLLATAALYLHIEGAQKADVLAAASGPGPIADLPIRAILGQSLRPLTIYWAP